MSFSGFTDVPIHHIIVNDGFFPDQNVQTFQAVYRLPAEYHLETVCEGLKQAMLWANDQLDDWKTVKTADGYHALIDVPGPQIGTDSSFSFLYARAVGNYAKAILLRQFYTVERRAAANNDAKEGQETEDVFFEYAQDAIADFLGVPRVTVGVI